MTIKRV